MKKLLFFDDFLAYRNDYTKRVFHQPQWLFEDAMTSNGVGGFCQGNSVVPAPHGGYYLYYVTVNKDTEVHDGSWLLCVAWSEDGLKFTPLAEQQAVKGIPGSLGYGIDYLPTSSTVFYDVNEKNPELRYKACAARFGFVPNQEDMRIEAPVLIASPDGINWTRVSDAKIMPHFVDCLMSIQYNPVIKEYQVLARRRWGERLIYNARSSDLLNWSDPVGVSHPLPSDPNTTHFYALPHTYLSKSNIFLGFLQKMIMPYNSVMFGPVFSEYVYSYNGLVWNRTDALVMEEGELGSYSSGSSYTFGLLEREDDVIVYCNAFEREHGRASNRPQGAKSPHSEVIVPGIIKRDRWVGLRSDRGRGEITTISLQFHSPEIFLNVNAPYGGVYAQILDSQGKPLDGFSYDDCEEIKGDYTRLAPNWRGGTPKLSSDNYYNIQVSFLEAELFAIEGDFGFTINTGVPAYDSF